MLFLPVLKCDISIMMGHCGGLLIKEQQGLLIDPKECGLYVDMSRMTSDYTLNICRSYNVIWLFYFCIVL